MFDLTESENRFIFEFEKCGDKIICSNNITDKWITNVIQNDLCSLLRDVIDESALNFLKNFDLVGNYMLVPGEIISRESFNTLRSDFGKNDTSDKMFLHIYKYFLDNSGFGSDVTSIRSLLVDNDVSDEISENFLNYLNDFNINSWDDFVSVHKLVFFVDDDLVPKSLVTGTTIDNKFIENPSLYKPMPKTYEECLNFFENYNTWTSKRCDEIFEEI